MFRVKNGIITLGLYCPAIQYMGLCSRCLGQIRDEIPHSYMGIIVNHYTTSISWKERPLFFFSWLRSSCIFLIALPWMFLVFFFDSNKL